jgi:hypothetical protein
MDSILGMSQEAPVFLDYKAVSRQEVQFRFSRPVSVSSLCFDPPQEADYAAEGDGLVRVFFTEAPQAGEKLLADLLVEDAAKNTLNVLIPFRSRNDDMPALVINELRTEYSSPKTEFIELFVSGAGKNGVSNLGALRVFIAGISAEVPVYEFPPVEVQTGEYVVLHLRSIAKEADLLKDETGANLALSGGTDALSTARDFWVPSTSKLLHKTDAVWIMDQDDRILDAVLLSETGGDTWPKQVFIDAAKRIAQEEAWLSKNKSPVALPSPEDAVITGAIKTALTRSVSRLPDTRGVTQNTHSSSDWIIAGPLNTKTPGATPGAPNSTNVYVP